MAKKYKFKLKTHKIQVVLDKFLFLKAMKKMHGRFWGIYGLLMLNIALIACFIIRPDLRTLDTAFSDFGTDIRTAPIFAAGVFAAAYGLWRWRNYLIRTFKRAEIITLLITLTIVGLYLVVFMPLGVSDTVESLHYFGFGLAGVCMGLTVLVDLILRKTKKGKNHTLWQLIRLFSFSLIVSGLFVTALSADRFGAVYNYSLVGEFTLLTGYGIWVITKTYQGEGPRSRISRVIDKILIIN